MTCRMGHLVAVVGLEMLVLGEEGEELDVLSKVLLFSIHCYRALNKEVR
jgi:hypothetical protein